MNEDPDLTQEQIDRICYPITQGAAQIRFLKKLGLVVGRKPSGRPLVNRKHYDEVRGRQPTKARATDEPAWGGKAA